MFQSFVGKLDGNVAQETQRQPETTGIRGVKGNMTGITEIPSRPSVVRGHAHVEVSDSVPEEVTVGNLSQGQI